MGHIEIEITISNIEGTKSTKTKALIGDIALEAVQLRANPVTGKLEEHTALLYQAMLLNCTPSSSYLITFLDIPLINPSRGHQRSIIERQPN